MSTELGPIQVSFEKRDYVSPKEVISAVNKLVQLFAIELNAENTDELIAMATTKIEQQLAGKSGVIVSEALGSVPLYKENDRTQIATFTIRNNLVAVMIGELADSTADHERMTKSIDLSRHRTVKRPDRDDIYSSAA